MQVLNGFVKIHRKLLQWGWYQDNVVKGVFIHILLTASFRESQWMGRTIRKGQVVVGIQKMADELGFTRQQIRTALKKLTSTNEIITETTNKFTVITVVNWEEYQVLDNEIVNKQPAEVVNKVLTTCKNLKKSTNKITNKNIIESRMGGEVEEIEENLSTNTLTIEQPSNNHQITNKQPHLKNVKEYKECKEREEEESSLSVDANVPQVIGGKIGKGVLVLSDNQFETLVEMMPLDIFNRYCEKLASWIKKNNRVCKNHFEIIKTWYEQDFGGGNEN